jgi:hypothetical protein
MRRRTVIMVAVLAALVGALVAAPVAVYAAHQFGDVPNSNPFHDDIDWLADAEVTLGCGGGQYCPEDFVTREQMAAFMRRLAENQVVDAGELQSHTAEELVPRLEESFNAVTQNFDDPTVTLTTVTIDAPTNGTVFLQFVVQAGAVTGQGRAWVEPGTSGCSFGSESVTVDATISQAQQTYVRWSSVDVAAGTHSYQLCGLLSASVFVVQTGGVGLSATFIPTVS